MIKEKQKVKAKSSNQIEVTQKGSLIGCCSDQKKTLVGLGLNKISATRVLEDTASIRGMVKKVKHLVSVEAV
jgi:large subunit ribosomal protein L30